VFTTLKLVPITICFGCPNTTFGKRLTAQTLAFGYMNSPIIQSQIKYSDQQGGWKDVNPINGQLQATAYLAVLCGRELFKLE
jgi:hypothetical protein